MKTKQIIKNSIGTFSIERSNSGKSVIVTHIYRGKPCGKAWLSSQDKINYSGIRRATLRKKAFAKRWLQILQDARYHHTASCRGYCSVSEVGQCKYYSGRFGEGYVKTLGPHNGSNSYTSIAYYILQTEISQDSPGSD